jgi:hypothetical protein
MEHSNLDCNKSQLETHMDDDHIALRLDSDSEDELELVPMMINQPTISETNKHFPQDIICHICKFLPPESVMEVCLINRDWYEACLEDGFWIPFLPSWKISRIPGDLKKGELRRLIIKTGKENARAKLSWKRSIDLERVRDRAYTWMNANTNRAVNFTVLCVYLCFAVFIFIMALRDVDTSIAAHALTSLWFAYTMYVDVINSSTNS